MCAGAPAPCPLSLYNFFCEVVGVWLSSSRHTPKADAQRAAVSLDVGGGTEETKRKKSDDDHDGWLDPSRKKNASLIYGKQQGSA